jgi:NADPH:quinone reductase-like Zn-dependent oxidoreductase
MKPLNLVDKIGRRSSTSDATPNRCATNSGRHYDLLLDNVGNRTLSAFRRVMTPRGRCVMAGAPKELWAVITRVLKALAWSPFLRQKFTFFNREFEKG